MHAKSYLDELQFIRRAVPSWSGRAELLAATMAFHLNNRLRRHGAGSHALDVCVLIEGESCPLRIRPNRGDLFILYEVLAREAYAIPPSVLHPEDVHVILDCGANIGITSLYFAKRYRNARIICIEPDPDNFDALKRNISGHERIEPVQAAVVGRSMPVHLTRDRPAYGNKVLDESEAGTIEVAGMTIADICAEHDIGIIDLLKVDIEGAEKDVFSDPVFLPKIGLIAIELHPPYGLTEFRHAIAPYGFRAEPPGLATCRHAHLATPEKTLRGADQAAPRITPSIEAPYFRATPSDTRNNQS